MTTNPFIELLERLDDAAELAAWLETKLVGLDLQTVIGELQVARRATGGREPRGAAATESLDELLGAQARRVLAEGLGCLEHQQLLGLVAAPELLLPLQERVLYEGGGYWQTLQRRDADLQAAVARQRARLFPTDAAAAPGAGPRPGATDWQFTLRSLRTFGLATAALLLLAVTLSLLTGPRPWGWLRPDALAGDQPAEYLVGLARGGQQWFQQRPTTAAAVAQRIQQYRAGCERLIAAPHTPLADADRRWLVARCKRWRAKFLEAESALTAGELSPLEARTRVDTVARSLTAALQARAAQLKTPSMR